MRSIERWASALGAQAPGEDHGMPFLWFDGRQTYDEALAAAGLLDQDGPVFPIKIIGVEPMASNLSK